jgi:hypothetical protein
MESSPVRSTTLMTPSSLSKLGSVRATSGEPKRIELWTWEAWEPEGRGTSAHIVVRPVVVSVWMVWKEPKLQERG